MSEYTDNRDACSVVLPSGCVPYTGYLSTTLAPLVTCKPNINDIMKLLQDSLDKINTNLGDNTTLDVQCLGQINASTATQKDLNQLFITNLCTILSGLGNGGIDPNSIILPIDLLCLIDPSCEVQSTYTLVEAITKLVTNYCSLATRVKTIETTLNL